MVRRDHGASVANEIARRLVTPPHREGGQAQYMTARMTESARDSLGTAMAWAPEHLTEPVTIEDPAARDNAVGDKQRKRPAHQDTASGARRMWARALLRWAG